MSGSRIVILLLSGASGVGLNVLATLRERRDALQLVATSSVADAPGLFDYDEVYLVPETADGELIFDQRMNDIFDRTMPDLVIPCRDDDVLWLANKAAQDPRWAEVALCGSRELAEVMLCKHASAVFCQQRGLPFVATIRLSEPTDSVDRFIAEHGFPLLLKPATEFASRRVSIATRRSQLERIGGATDLVAQPFLGDAGEIERYLAEIEAGGVPLFHSFEGIKTSIQAYIAPDGGVCGVFATRNTMRAGKSESVHIETDAEVIELGRSSAGVFAELGWRGPLNLQCQRSRDGELKIFELNGRFTGATSARYLLGYDEVGLAVRWHALHQLPDVVPGVEACTAVARLPESCSIQSKLVEVLRPNGRWVSANTP